jgi:hypothetical protein
VDDCVHWLDLRTAEVEFRPVESSWIPDLSNWRLSVREDHRGWVFRRTSGGSASPAYLIDIRSPTFGTISRLLSALESPQRIIVTRTNQLLEVSLPRMRLIFFVNQDSELECRSMPGYVIDEVQSCGTMFGLENRLILCPSNGASEMPRRVIIPQGCIIFGLDGDFSRVSISTGSGQHVYWHEYTIDNDLGRLTGNVSLRSKLYQCYLHALTSHCLPDPLLGHTGTEESLNILQSAAFLSFQRLSDEDVKILHLISKLVPSRVYYPPHLQSMVTVEWHDLPVLSQHHDFHPAVNSILDHACAMEALYDKPVDFEISPRDSSLLNRAASRNEVYYPRDLQSLRHSSRSLSEDVAYESRDIVDGQGGENAAYQMAWSVWNARPYLPRKWLNLWDEIQSWRTIGPSHEQISLRYSRYWLTFNAAQDWLGIYDLCQETLTRDRQESKVKLAFSLSAACFSSSNRADIVPLVLIFATDLRFLGLTRPPATHYELSDGTKPDQSRLQNMICRFRLPLDQTPAKTLEVRATDWEQASRERKEEYLRITNHKTLEAAQSVMARWPARNYDLSPQWFDTQSCRESVDNYRQSISRNIDFRAHIHRLIVILNSYETRTPPKEPYSFSPHLSARPTKAPCPSLREILMSRANFPQRSTRKRPSPGCAIMPPTLTMATKSNPSPARDGGLSLLIQELRLSRESFLNLYGEDLNKSYRDLLGKWPSFLVQRKVPPQDALLRYRDLCSEGKDAIFSELSEVLAPSQKSENVISVSGLWPRITPRSILRELSRDRVRTLTDRWKHVITRYAVAFLKYQQSQRLVELSSRRRHEELLREAETICEDVAAACSPDWLLIQVSLFPHIP